MAEQNHPTHDRIAGHELSDLNPGRIALFGAVLTIVVGTALLATYALFQSFYTGVTRSRALPSPLSYSREPTPEPRLLVKPGEELAVMRAQENKILENYEWVDREKGIVRIPIERAIDMIAQKGLPARSNSGKTAASGNQPLRQKEVKKR